MFATDQRQRDIMHNCRTWVGQTARICLIFEQGLMVADDPPSPQPMVPVGLFPILCQFSLGMKFMKAPFPPPARMGTAESGATLLKKGGTVVGEARVVVWRRLTTGSL